MNVDAAVQDLGSFSKRRRVRAIQQLVECGEPAVELLTRVAGRRWGYAPAGAIEALGRIGDPRACSVVRNAIRWRPPRISHAAIVATGRLRDADAFPILCRLCATSRLDRARSFAAWALGEIGNPDALSTLLRLMRHGSRVEREAARQAAEQIGRLAPERLAQHLDSTSLGALAAGVLSDMGEEAIPGLVAVAASDRHLAATRAVALLGAMGLARPEHRPTLLETLRDQDPTFCTAAASGLASLATRSPDPHLRGAIDGLRRREKSSPSPLERRYYHQAIATIEGATAHLKQLPVPVDHCADATASLPLPATAEEALDERLPIPTEDRSDVAAWRS